MGSYVIILVIVVFLMLKEKEIRPSRLWITPALFAYLTFSSMTGKYAVLEERSRISHDLHIASDTV